MTRPRYPTNRTALVTGAAHGIGLATARALAGARTRVALLDIDGDRAAAEAKALPGARSYCADVSDRDAFAHALRSAEAELGAVDILVNNAGVMVLGPLMDVSPNAIRRVIEVNLIGVVNGLQLALPAMAARREGRVVNVSSVAGRWGISGENVYVASKHALEGLAEVVRAELDGSGVKVSTVYMGPVEGPRLSLGMRQTGLVRFTTPEAVAQSIVASLSRGPAEIWVPRSLGFAVKATQALPRGVRDRLKAGFGVNRVATEVDRAARATYERRVFGPD